VQCALLTVKAAGERLDSVEPHERSRHETRPAGARAKEAVESVRNAEGGKCREGRNPLGEYGRPACRAL